MVVNFFACIPSSHNDLIRIGFEREQVRDLIVSVCLETLDSNICKVSLADVPF
jgi:hypothetical protein